MMSDSDIRRLAEIGINVPALVSPELEALLREILAAPTPRIPMQVGMGSGGDGRDFEGPRVSIPMGSLTSTSLNWSGAVCSSRGPRFTFVFGKVKIPPRPSPPAPPRQNRDYHCSVWIGMGGQRRWDKSLPQAGVMMGFRAGSNIPFIYAWQQWFLGTNVDPYSSMDTFDVTWGDEILLGATRGPSANEVFTYFVNVTRPAFDRGSLISPTEMRGVTAEWIVERPSPWEDLKNPYPLFNYGEVGFDQCVAYGDPQNVRTLSGARMVRMVERRSNPSRTHFISVPKPVAGSGITVSYRP